VFAARGSGEHAESRRRAGEISNDWFLELDDAAVESRLVELRLAAW
jgi:hypothetical protein